MIEKGKITDVQMWMLLYPTILATAILLVPAITSVHAERDMWLSPMWASLIGFLTVYIANKLHQMFPHETVIQYGDHLLGKMTGKVIGLIYLLFYLHINGIVIREYAEFVVGMFLHHTPITVVMGSMTLACAFAVRTGVEVLGRLAEMIIPIVILLLVLIIILLLPDVEGKHMFPIIEKGIIPSIKGAMIPQSWFSEFFVVTFLLPFLTDREKGMKSGLISVCSVMLTMFLINLVVLLIFGELTSGLTYPIMNAVRYISIADFLEHIEAVVMAIWVAGAFIKICVFYYVLALGTAQWLKLSDYRVIVWPLGLLLVLFAVWSAPNLQELEHFLGTSASFYFTLVQTVLPLLLLLVACIRKRKPSQNRGGAK